jgi:hypothetical protein
VIVRPVNMLAAARPALEPQRPMKPAPAHALLLTPLCAEAQKSIALPDMHSGYGFAIGNVAAFDMADPLAVVSPGGVGFDINCGVRLIRTNLVRRCASAPSGLPGCGQRVPGPASETVTQASPAGTGTMRRFAFDHVGLNMSLAPVTCLACFLSVRSPSV